MIETEINFQTSNHQTGLLEVGTAVVFFRIGNMFEIPTVFIGVSTLFAGLLYLLHSFYSRKTSSGKLPPSPPGWPLIGNAALMFGNRHAKLMETGKKLGGIFTFKVGVRQSVWITSYKLFREALVNNASALAGRPPEMHIEGVMRDRGLVASGVSEPEKDIRKFSLITLRNFGFGKTSMQDAINQEANGIVEEFAKMGNQSFYPRSIIANAAANVISAILLGKTFEQGHEGMRAIGEDLTDGIKLVMKIQTGDAFPLLKLLFYKSKAMLIQKFRKASSFLEVMVKDHIVTREPGSPRDFIDTWLDKMYSDDQKDRETYAERKLPGTLLDIFTGGFETTTTTFQWIFAMLLHHPEVQEKVHAELDFILGDSKAVTLEDRDSLVYTEAVILETLRVFPLIPFSVPHMTVEEVVVGGYVLPENTRVITHIYSIHHDPDLWENPEEFNPERFVQHGKLVVPEHFVPFSAGRRSCLGEQLARKELFLFFATIMKSFDILLPEGDSMPSLKLNDTVVMYPDAFDIRVKAR